MEINLKLPTVKKGSELLKLLETAARKAGLTSVETVDSERWTNQDGPASRNVRLDVYTRKGGVFRDGNIYYKIDVYYKIDEGKNYDELNLIKVLPARHAEKFISQFYRELGIITAKDYL